MITPKYLNSDTQCNGWPWYVVILAEVTLWRCPIRVREDFFTLILMSKNCRSLSHALKKDSRADIVTAIKKISSAYIIINNYYWHCSHSMRSRVYVTVRCLSVCLSQHGPTAANPLLRICCCGPGGQELSIDCCRRSAASAGECGHCHDVSIRRKLNTE